MHVGSALLRSHRNRKEFRGTKEDFSMKHDQTDINEFLDSKKYLDDSEPDEDLMVESFPDEQSYEKYLQILDREDDILSVDHSRCSKPIYLRIPKRPSWDYSDDKESLLYKEAESFTAWKRSIRLLEKSASPVLCPYEKNIELWRQLWRVVERCDVILNILDCRNPNVYRSLDLENDISSRKKMIIYVLNKSDLINSKQREVWAEYFRRLGKNFIFFASETDTRSLVSNKPSHLEEKKTKKVKHRQSKRLKGMISLPTKKDAAGTQATLEDQLETGHMPKNISDSMKILSLSDAKNMKNGKIFTVIVDALEKKHPYFNKASMASASDVRSLLSSLRTIKGEVDSLLEIKVASSDNKEKNSIQDVKVKIGLVGFPNVGKSSFLNSLMCQKKVATSSRPGKTKYFQSLVLPGSPGVILHDSPGILFPSLSKDTGTALCEGKVCVEAAKNHEKHLIDVCKHVSLLTLEEKYKISLPKCEVTRPEDYVDVLLTTFACSRGYLGTFSQPLKSVTALKMMQDFVRGAVVFATPPPLKTSEFEALSRVIKKCENLSEKVVFEKAMSACDKIYEARKIPTSGAKSPSKDFYIPIKTSPLGDKAQLYYELHFNRWLEAN